MTTGNNFDYDTHYLIEQVRTNSTQSPSSHFTHNTKNQRLFFFTLNIVVFLSIIDLV